MQLLRGFYNIPATLIQSVVTIGTFDGVHLGHQALFQRLKQLSHYYQVPSIVVTFEPTPVEYFLHEKANARLTRLREKIHAIEEIGIDYLVCLRFDKKLAQQSAEAFVKNIVICLHPCAIVVGDDFRFGAKRQGDFYFLERYCKPQSIHVEQITQYQQDHERVSSSRVRRALQEGNLEEAQQLLGRPYIMQGRVVHGDKRGRELGFPTANIYLHRKVSPLRGIFAVRVQGLERVYKGVAYVGSRPAVGGEKVILEVFIFDFNQTLYGKALTVEFLHQLREDKHFDNLEDLKAQMASDVESARDYFKRIETH
ncbi:MAG TPA: bifunctional riboflavin kinase/FAD synthetase [Coxiellaceae bacterium]|nr:bifunctional riboflavin kinase/FAD synthetase [Coxiellaceae bacterium]